jgi:hypothetical protein
VAYGFIVTKCWFLIVFENINDIISNMGHLSRVLFSTLYTLIINSATGVMLRKPSYLGQMCHIYVTIGNYNRSFNIRYHTEWILHISSQYY